MIKKGLEILRARRVNTKVTTEMSLPPIYSIFTSCFELGEDGFNYDKYYISSKDRLRYLQNMYYIPRGNESNNITFTHFDTLETVSNNWQKKLGYIQEDIDLNLIRIGGIALGGGLFVGNDKNEDNIYFRIWDSKEGLVKLENDIFSFANQLILEPMEILSGNINHSQLYRNWHENFWRINEKEIKT